MALAFAGLSFGPASIASQPGDAMVYWVAAEKLQQGGDIYELERWDTFDRPYIYPPAAAALFVPFTWWDDRPDVSPPDRSVMKPYPYPTVLRVWALMHGLAWAGAIILLARSLAPDRRTRFRVAAIATLATAGLLWLDAWYGNVNVFILVMLAAGIALTLRGRQWRGGMILGIAAMIKVMPVVLLPIFLVQRRFKACAGLVAGAALLWLLPLVWLVPELGFVDGIGQNFWLSGRFLEKHVLPSLGSGSFGQTASYMFVNASPMAALQRLFGDGTQLFLQVWDKESYGPLLFTLPQPLIKLLGLLIPAIMFALAGHLAWKRREPRAQWAGLGLAFLAASSANVLFWHYHLVMLVLPAGVLALYLPDPKRRPLVTAALAAWILLLAAPQLVVHMGNEYRFVQWAMAWGMPTLGYLTGWFCAWQLVRRDRPAVPETQS